MPTWTQRDWTAGLLCLIVPPGDEEWERSESILIRGQSSRVQLHHPTTLFFPLLLVGWRIRLMKKDNRAVERKSCWYAHVHILSDKAAERLASQTEKDYGFIHKHSLHKRITAFQNKVWTLNNFFGAQQNRCVCPRRGWITENQQRDEEHPSSWSQAHLLTNTHTPSHSFTLKSALVFSVWQAVLPVSRCSHCASL